MWMVAGMNWWPLTPNGLEMSRPASSRILLVEPKPQLAGSAPSSCWAALGSWAFN
jgi:hypothetical protein